MKAAPEKRVRALALKAAEPDRLNLSIAREVGVTAATVWKWLHPDRTREFQAADNAGRQAEKNAWARSEKGRATRRRLMATYVAVCVDCGGACGKGTRYTDTERCARCNQAFRRRNHEVLLDRIERLWNVDGLTTAPATVCGDLARGDAHVVRLGRERDIAEGVRDAAQQAGWRHAANRRDVQRFVEWSMRRELAEVGVGA